MLQDFLFFLFIIAQFGRQCHVLAGDPIYECYAWGDPHIHTWRLIGSDLTPNEYQDCYQPGRVDLVNNAFVRYTVHTSLRLMTEIDFWFYNGTSLNPFCLIHTVNFEIYPDDQDRCNRNGVMWKLLNDTDQYVLVVNYFKANFSTTIQHGYWSRQSHPHFNINVWQTKSLTTRSKGLCTKGDPYCRPTIRTSDSKLNIESLLSPRQTMISNHANDICKIYINTYLNKSRRKLNRQRIQQLKNTLDNVMNGCVEDVMFTGISEMARSSLSVIMIEELTSDVISIDSIQTAIESDIKEAFMTVHDATHEAEAEISQFFDFTTELTPDDTATDTTTIENTQEIPTTTTTTVPIAPFQCGVYQDIYIQTWHPIGQAFPPSRSCLGKAATFELVKNDYLRYTLHSNGSVIDELTLILFDEISTEAICTVSAIGQVISWMDCEQNGIIPSLLTTPTHETLTVYYANAHFTTTVTRDIGIYVGRFNIVTYLNPELALRSSGICNLASPCVGTDRAS